MKFRMMDSPIGRLKLVASARGLAAILWEDDDPRRVRIDGAVEDDNDPILLKAQTQLEEYFAGKRKAFALDLSARRIPSPPSRRRPACRSGSPAGSRSRRP